MLPPARNPLRTRVRRTARGLGLAALAAAVLMAGHRPVLTGFARQFRVDDPAPSDALVLLLGGFDHRPEKVAELYRQGLAPRILMARSPKPKTVFGTNETEEAERVLIKAGIPREAILVLPQIGTSTREEAQYVREYAKAHPMRRITVVTTAFHTARARWIFQKTLDGMGIDVRMAATRHPVYDETDWYTRDEGLLTYFNETIKTLIYRVMY